MNCRFLFDFFQRIDVIFVFGAELLKTAVL